MIKDKCDLILVAGGSSLRYRGKLPKQFETVHGRPLYLWSLEPFLRWPELGHVIIVVPGEWLDPVRQSFNSILSLKPIHFVGGGQSRQESVLNALNALRELSGNNWVMVHDGARPLLSTDFINQLWSTLVNLNFDVDAVIPGLPAKETIKRVRHDSDSKTVVETLNRDQLYIIQTPQLLRTQALVRAQKELGLLNAVDDAVLIEKIGGKVVVTEGHYDNLKVTFTEDMERVSSWLRDRYP